MSLPAQRLSRAHRLIYRGLRRGVATQEALHTRSSTEISPPKEQSAIGAEFQNVKNDLPSSGNFEANHSTIIQNLNAVSEVRWPLAEGYETNGNLKAGNGLLNRHDETGLPLWGEWGIPLRVRTWSGSKIMSL